MKRNKLALAVAAIGAMLEAAAFGYMRRSGLLLMAADDGGGDVATVQKSLDGIKNQINEWKGAAESEVKKTGELATKTREAVDEILVKHNELTAQVRELEQKAVAAAASLPVKLKTVGETVADSEQFKRLHAAGNRGSMSLSIDKKAVTSTAAGGLIRSQREQEVIGLPRRDLTVRDLIPSVPTTTSSIDFAKMTSRTLNAAPVAEGAAKPYSDWVWGSATVPVRLMAHLAKLTRQAMDDAPRLVAEVDNEMRYGLDLVTEAQILFGDGTGQNLHGIVPQASAFVNPIPSITSPTRVDMLRLAMLQASSALYPPDGVVISEIDWAGIELMKDGQNAYLFGGPNQAQPRTMWRLPVVATPAMTVDKFLTGNFRMGATVYDRMAIEVLISTENVDDFEKNLATMRAEERLALAVKRPGAFIYGDFGLVA